MRLEQLKMDPVKTDNNWYFLIVQNPGTPDEEFVGFTHPETLDNFLPVFKSRQEAEDCFTLMPKDLFNEKYDIHAIIEEDLMAAAQTAGHQIYILDKTGKILSGLK
ncbi:MAG: hypothetical protein MI747_04135 [Desulfobacterales bacterium]|nr:hypothetical protein [Desulfobacterales bacterium]